MTGVFFSHGTSNDSTLLAVAPTAPLRPNGPAARVRTQGASARHSCAFELSAPRGRRVRDGGERLLSFFWSSIAPHRSSANSACCGGAQEHASSSSILAVPYRSNASSREWSVPLTERACFLSPPIARRSGFVGTGGGSICWVMLGAPRGVCSHRPLSKRRMVDGASSVAPWSASSSSRSFSRSSSSVTPTIQLLVALEWHARRSPVLVVAD